MHYTRLGESGLLASRLVLGTGEYGTTVAESVAHDLLDRFVESGGTLIDTADLYGGGASERIIGGWLRSRPEWRDSVSLASKARHAIGTGAPAEDVLGVGLSRARLRRALDASLTRLGVEHIDLYQIHAFDPWTPVDETLSFVSDAVAQGKIGYFGLSNATGWQIARYAERSDVRSRPISAQVQFNLLSRQVEWEVVPACRAYGIDTMAWWPLAGGWLTGQYTRDRRPTVDRDWVGEVGDRSSTWTVIDAVRDVGVRTGLSVAQVAIAWAAASRQMDRVIVGARTLDQLDEAVVAVDADLGAHVDELDAVSRPIPADYPYGEHGASQRARNL